MSLNSFADLGIKYELLRGVYGYGFETPSAIQSIAIQPMINGQDLIAQAQSGTGKTGTFAIGTLQNIDENVKQCQAIIVAPTRELAYQINFVVESLGTHMTNVSTVLCIGGSNIRDTISNIRAGAQIIIGTPGRIINMIKKDIFSTRAVKLLVMDEADELLSESFLKQIRYIVEQIPETAQICLFSATMPFETLNTTKSFIPNAKHILIKKEQLTLEGIKQFYVNVEREEWKLDTFCDLYNTFTISQSMIYVNTKDKANWLYSRLQQNNFTVSLIHSDMEPLNRTKIMNEFRQGKSRILVSTDLLARGIDIQQVSIVVNYDVPYNKENYIHRIGRSGRYGRKGVAINFITQRDERILRDIERYYSTQIEEMPENIHCFL